MTVVVIQTVLMVVENLKKGINPRVTIPDKPVRVLCRMTTRDHTAKILCKTGIQDSTATAQSIMTIQGNQVILLYQKTTQEIPVIYRRNIILKEKNMNRKNNRTVTSLMIQIMTKMVTY